jgi:hypothetical protein
VSAVARTHKSKTHVFQRDLCHHTPKRYDRKQPDRLNITLDKLFFHGRLLIARRHESRRVYDLPERVLSASVLHAPEPSTEENRRWLVHLGLR